MVLRALMIAGIALAGCNAASTAPTERVLAGGNFYNVVHDGSGRASVIEKPDGSRALRLENFSVTNGPVLEVWLSAATNPKDSPAISGAAYLSLGALKSTSGNQEYPIPQGANLSGFHAVTIWCVQFKVNFSSAELN